MNEIALSMLPVIILLTLIQAYTPFVTRKSECFGVSIPQSEFHNPNINAMRKSYALYIVLIGLITCAAVFLFGTANVMIWTILPLPLIGVDFGVYYLFHRRMKAFKNTTGWAQNMSGTVVVDTSPDEADYPSPIWLLVYPVMILMTIAFIASTYPNMPDRIPMHFNFAGIADRYANKTLMTAYFPVFAQAFMTIIFTGCYFVIKTARKQIDPENPEKSRHQVTIFRRSWGQFILFCGALMLLLFAGIPFLTIGVLSASTYLYFTLGMTGAICAASVYLAVKIGQGGSRVSGPSNSKVLNVRDDDRFWKLGVFYFNPDDPSLFVEKRFGIGWTSNFARPMTYVIIAGFILLMAVFTFVSINGTAS